MFEELDYKIVLTKHISDDAFINDFAPFGWEPKSINRSVSDSNLEYIFTRKKPITMSVVFDIPNFEKSTLFLLWCKSYIPRKGDLFNPFDFISDYFLEQDQKEKEFRKELQGYHFIDILEKNYDLNMIHSLEKVAKDMTFEVNLVRYGYNLYHSDYIEIILINKDDITCK